MNTLTQWTAVSSSPEKMSLNDKWHSFEENNVHILDTEGRWFERRVKEAIYVKSKKRTLNWGGGFSFPLSNTYNASLTFLPRQFHNYFHLDSWGKNYLHELQWTIDQWPTGVMGGAWWCTCDFTPSEHETYTKRLNWQIIVGGRWNVFKNKDKEIQLPWFKPLRL